MVLEAKEEKKKRLEVFNGKSPACTSGDHFSLIMKYQQGGKVMHASVSKPGPLVTTNSSPTFPSLAAEDTPVMKRGEVTSWAEACCPCPATPHELGSTSCWCWLVPLSTGSSPNPRVCSVSVRQRLMARSCCIPRKRPCVRVREQEKAGNNLSLLLLTQKQELELQLSTCTPGYVEAEKAALVL